MLKQIIEITIMGVGLAAVWFYMRSMLTGDLSGQSIYRWAIILIPLSIAIIWGLRVLSVL